MIREVTMYQAVCDRCGRPCDEIEGIMVWANRESARIAAWESGWLIVNHETYCPDCYEYDEETDEWAFWDSGTKRSDYNYFDDTIACPTQALAARWLREVHGIHVYAIQTNLPYTEPQTTKWEWGYVIGKIDDPNSNIATCEMYFGSYEDAFEAGVAKCLELIKK